MKHNSFEPENINIFIAKIIVYQYIDIPYFFNLFNFKNVYYYSYISNNYTMILMLRKNIEIFFS